MVAGNDVAMSPRTYVSPLAEDLVRAMRSAPVDSTADRRTVTRAARTRLHAVDLTVDRMRDSVAILDPGGRYTLASERSPLLLVVRNDLPLSIRVRLDTAAPEDLDIGDVGVVEIPPRGTRQIQLPTQAKSSASMTVNIALVTSSNVAVGSAIDLSVHSNAYGKPLFIITICAGVLLVLLAGRRLWHRFRGQPDRPTSTGRTRREGAPDGRQPLPAQRRRGPVTTRATPAGRGRPRTTVARSRGRIPQTGQAPTIRGRRLAPATPPPGSGPIPPPSGPMSPPSGPVSHRPDAAVAVTTQTEALDDVVDPTPAVGRDQPSDESVLRTAGRSPSPP